MSNENIESISARLRRVADGERNPFTLEAAREEFEVAETPGWGDIRSVLSKIADDIDREMDELRDQLQQPGGIPIEDVVREIATCDKNDGACDPLKAAIIEYFLPRPLFEDGEPVQLGDTVVDKLRGEMLVTRMCHVGKGVYFNESHNPWGKKLRKTRIAYAPGERVERPEPKVLDADGVPIEVGDKVWMLPGKHCETFPLYGYKVGVEYTVTENESASHKENGRICITGGDCIYGYPMPEQVTHREPDTQERIDEDATMPPREYYTKHIGHDVGLKDDEEVWTAVAAHLLRRQRELDGRDA